ncbi:DNA-directed RNA polymerase subunit beta [symbiont of Argiope bruennichi]|uniref:DNA-directed RNA polymerase subunit beta n=1 Tax=symbiont of Argiope bruennichi TaxID=2810479 RepID=UPI003DA50AD3
MVSYTIKQCGDYIERINFSKKKKELEIPNLLLIQKKKFQELIDFELEETFSSFFPITNKNKTISLVFNKLYFEEPKIDYLTAKKLGKNYEYTINCSFSLLINNKVVQEKKVFLCFLPKMSYKGTFVVNGVEKVVVSQIVRSPGIYFAKIFEKNIGRFIYYFNFIPLFGTWLEFFFDLKEHLFVKLEKNRKISFAIFWLSLNLTEKQALELFLDDEMIENSFSNFKDYSAVDARKDFYHKLKPGEPIRKDEDIVKIIENLLFNEKNFSLGKAGRLKVNKKLNICERAYHKYLAEDILDRNNKVIFSKGTFIGKKETEILSDLIEKDKLKFFELKISPKKTLRFYRWFISNENNSDSSYVILGTQKSPLEEKQFKIQDFIVAINYFLNLKHNIGETDDIDDLSNRRVRTSADLIKNQIVNGLLKIEKGLREMIMGANEATISFKNLFSNKYLLTLIKDFFNTSQLCQFLDQTNPLAELANKRRISSLGVGGLNRERAGFEVRDVRPSFYGRFCPIETPEGQNIGLISNLATFARVNDLGFIETPYLKVKDGKVLQDEVVYLEADEEQHYIIGQAKIDTDEDNNLTHDLVIARYKNETIEVEKEKVNYIDVSPKQLFSISACTIPFLEHNDTTRALMGSNMQRQAVPVLNAENPLIATGIEYQIAKDSGLALLSSDEGVVEYVDGNEIVIKNSKGELINHKLYNYLRSNKDTLILQKPLVNIGDIVKKDQLIADGPGIVNGELALGNNILVAFISWYGYNFEDAIIVSERLIEKDIFTSVHIKELEIECRSTKQGSEEITWDIPNISSYEKRFLDEDGLIIPGTRVQVGDILVGKITPRGESNLTPEDRLLQVIFGEKSKNYKDTSLRVPNGYEGIVLSVHRYSKRDYENLGMDVFEIVKVFIAQKRKIQAGDKMSGRHGNKGVISKVVPKEDMPFLADGTPIDIILNPLGIPSRMNIGQVLELHLGLVAKKNNWKIFNPIFDGITIDQINTLLKENFPEAPEGKFSLYDGLTGEKFKSKISVGYIYLLKLYHMVEEKIHARNVGPYSLITQQPLGGKAQNGGQRFGEMEVWALEAYGASHLLQEMLTLKADDINGRINVYNALISGNKIPGSSIPESFLVLIRELKGLGLNVIVHQRNNFQKSEEDPLLDKKTYLESIDSLEKESEDFYQFIPKKDNMEAIFTFKSAVELERGEDDEKN